MQDYPYSEKNNWQADMLGRKQLNSTMSGRPLSDDEIDSTMKDLTAEMFAEKKRWLFKENIRLEELKRNLEDERKVMDIQKGMLEKQQSRNMLLRKQLQNQKSLFDRQWQILERETRQLAIDKERFDREKRVYRDEVYREARRGMSYSENVKIFFKGVDDTASLKQRYKALMKIFHPDNTHGDKELIQAINTEYEQLKRYYLGT